MRLVTEPVNLSGFQVSFCHPSNRRFHDMKIAFLAKQNHPNPRRKKADAQENLWVMDADGCHRHLMASHLGWGTPQWSPDGKFIAFEKFDDAGRRHIYVIDRDGTELRCVSQGNNCYSPAWSPDGKQLAYSNFYTLFALEVASQEQRVVAEGKSICNVRWLSDENLCWNAWTNPHASSPMSGIYTASSRGGPSRRLSPAQYNCGEFSVSPDGNFLAFRMNTGISLLVMPQDGSRLWKLIDGPFVSNIAWSPDGTQILVHLTQGEESGLHFLNLHDGTKHRFTGHYAFTATWSPDGQQIAFSSSSNDDTDIHLYSVQTRVHQPITFDRRSHCPAWQPSATAAPVTPVTESTFHWAKLIYERQAMAKKQFAHNPNFVVRWAQFLADPETRPPFQIRLGIQSTGASGVKVLMDGVVFECENIPDGVQKLQQVIKLLNFPFSDDFMLVYPRYAVEEPSAEQTLHLISGLIFDAAQAQGWGFERELPEPVWPEA